MGKLQINLFSANDEPVRWRPVRIEALHRTRLWQIRQKHHMENILGRAFLEERVAPNHCLHFSNRSQHHWDLMTKTFLNLRRNQVWQGSGKFRGRPKITLPLWIWVRTSLHPASLKIFERSGIAILFFGPRLIPRSNAR